MYASRHCRNSPYKNARHAAATMSHTRALGTIQLMYQCARRPNATPNSPASYVPTQTMMDRVFTGKD